MARSINAAMFIDLESAAGGGMSRRFDPARLVTLAEEDFDAKLRLASAYADFRNYQGYIESLHLTGLEPVQVTGYRAGQQSVDMKLCCDVMTTAYERPDIVMFILLANDTDYVPLVRHLRKLGKSIFLLCRKTEVQERAYGAFCDRIVDYSQLLEDSSIGVRSSAGEGAGPPPARSEHEIAALLRAVHTALGDILQKLPNGLPGAKLLPQLRLALGQPNFDFSDVGFAAALPFAHSIAGNGIVVEHDGVSDFRIKLDREEPPETDASWLDWLIRNSVISNYAFRSDASHRHGVIETIFTAGKERGRFIRRELLDDCQARSGLTRTEIDKYFSVLTQAKLFERDGEEGQEDGPIHLRFREALTLEAVERAYEASIVYKALFFLNRLNRLPEWSVERYLALFDYPDTPEMRARARDACDTARATLDERLAADEAPRNDEAR